MLHIGKHSEAGQKILEQKEKEIVDMRIRYVEVFYNIRNLCFINNYGNKFMNIRKIYEIAEDNHAALINALYKTKSINEQYEEKIIELITTDQSNN